MKTKNLIQLAFVLVSAMTISLTSCKKDNSDQGTVNTASLKQLSADENDVESIMNDAEEDVSSVMAGNGGLKSTDWLPCNATLDSLAVENDTVTMFITYNGLTCNNRRMRTGKIEIKKKVGTWWPQAGATVIYKYINFKVTRVANNTSVTLNGTKTFENVNGGLRRQVGTLIDSYVERMSGSMQASFDNGTSRTWNVSRQITYTGTPGQLLLTIDGLGSEGNYQNLVVWGTNRLSEQFYTQITQPEVCRQACNWDPVSGVKIHQIPSASQSATITYGFNDNNEPISGDECPTRYRIDWQWNNQSGTSYLPL